MTLRQKELKLINLIPQINYWEIIVISLITLIIHLIMYQIIIVNSKLSIGSIRNNSSIIIYNRESEEKNYQKYNIRKIYYPLLN